MKKKLIRDTQNQMLCGVCSGIAAYFNIDVSIVRLIWILFSFCLGGGIIAYIICAIVIPAR